MLKAGSFVKCHFRTEKQGKSQAAEEATCLGSEGEIVTVNFGDGIEQDIPKQWLVGGEFKPAAETLSSSGAESAASDQAPCLDRESEREEQLARIDLLENEVFTEKEAGGTSNKEAVEALMFAVYLPHKRVHRIVKEYPLTTHCGNCPGIHWLTVPVRPANIITKDCGICFP